MKIGLVLEGGGMRGLYTAGVLDYMMEKGFTADVICGTSAGVTFGINMPSGQKGRVLRYNTSLVGDKRYISLHSLLTTGDIVNTKFAYDTLPNILDPFDYDTFEHSKTEFYATLTNVNTGKTEYLPVKECHKDMDIIRASASLPFLSNMVEISGEKYLDGGITDNIPIEKCLETGCDKIIVILTHPEGYIKKERLSGLSRIVYSKYPRLIEAFERRNRCYNARLKQIAQMEARGEIMVMRPSRAMKVGRLEKNASRLVKLHNLGYCDMKDHWLALKDYLDR